LAFAIALYLDTRADREARAVWQAVRQATGSATLLETGMGPHVTLAIHGDAEEGALRAALDAFDGPGTEFVLASAGTFPGEEGVVFLAPVVDDPLLRLHRSWHALVPGSEPLYAPGSWVPHLTVGYALPEEALPAALAAARASLPLRGRFESVVLVEFERRAAGPVRQVAQRPLGSMPRRRL